MTEQMLLDKFEKAEPITRGWSEDKKYCVTTSDGIKYLLRIAPISRYEVRKSLFTMLQRVAALDIPMSAPIKIGTYDDEVYSLLSWIDGEDAEKALPQLSETEQYVSGLKAGEILSRIHMLSAPENENDWDIRYFGIMDERVAAYQNCEISFSGDEAVLDYLKANRHLLKDRPQCFRHGDYSVGNLMITKSHDVFVVDWEADDFHNSGDPWLDFADVVWGADKSPHFASGVIKGYFGDNPPAEFWERLMFYVFTAIISSIQWVA